MAETSGTPQTSSADLGVSRSGSNPGSRRASRNSTGLNLPHRQQSIRIDEILETARERAGAMASPQARSPRNTDGLAHRSQNAAGPGHEDSSADEHTQLVGSASRRSLRSLNSALKNPSRRSGLNGDTGGAHPHVPETDDRPTEHETNGTAHTKKSWAKQALGRFKSVELENKGSVARDHLALERTFLAWLRTSLAFASIGIAVTQLFRLNTSLTEHGSEPDGRTHALRHMGKPLGATFLGISVLTLLLGYRRYVNGQEWIIKGKFPASRGTVIILVAMSFAIMVLSLVVVIVIHPSEEEDL